MPLRAAVGLLMAALGATGADAACRLALALGIDISSSVDPAEDALQRQGLARALRSDEVRQAVFALPGDTVALAVFEWSGRYQQDMILDWTQLRDPKDLAKAAAIVARSRRSYADFPTATGYALGYAAGLLKQGPACLFRTIDLSGDGVNNDGFGPARAYTHFPFQGVTVNGLAIDDPAGETSAYYRAEVLHGPGAFLEIAEGFADFERAIRRKLVRELGARVIGAAQAE